MKNQRGISLLGVLVTIAAACIFSLLITPLIRSVIVSENEAHAQQFMSSYVATYQSCLAQPKCQPPVPLEQEGYAFSLSRNDAGYDFSARPVRGGYFRTGEHSYYANEKGWWMKDGYVAPVRDEYLATSISPPEPASQK